MKHRLPKPKSLLVGPDQNPANAQSELPIDEKPRSSTPATDPVSPTPSVTDAPLLEKRSAGTPPPLPVAREERSRESKMAGTFVTSDQEEDSLLVAPQVPAARPPPLPVQQAPPLSEQSFVDIAAVTVSASNGLPPEIISEPVPPVVAKESAPQLASPPPLPLLLTPRPVPVHLPATNLDHAPLLIETRGLVKQYGERRVVNGVDIHVKAGEVVGLLGKNGAGKTTTFYMIVGLVQPTLGHVYMSDEDVTRMPMYRRARRGVGYLPQEESIFRKLSVEDNLLAILETLPMTEEERETRCDELLKDFGLEHVRENIAITLSGGEKRRVTIARALVTSPSLLMLDEPFSGVDPMAVHDIQEIILHLKERGLGVLITDHNVRETLSVVDRAYIIDEGRVLSEGTREFLLNDPIAREIYLGHRFSM
jgi:lipopolysaccharide export system ATP-binding protein